MKKAMIFGNGQSGSTLLSLLIGANSKVINCGEVFVFINYFKNFPDKICMDGIKISEHPLWSSVFNDLEKNGFKKDSLWKKNNRSAEEFNDKSKIFFKSIWENCDEKTMVFSSKQQFRLRYMLEDNSVSENVFPIFLIRDPRAYINSFLKRHKKKKQFKSRKELFVIISRSFSWSFNALKAIYLIKKNKSDFFIIRYEDLTSKPEIYLNKIMDYLKLDFEKKQLDYFDIKQPMFSGNGSLMDRRDRVSFRTDFLKIANFKWILVTVLTLPVLIYFKYPLFKKSYKNFDVNERKR